MFNVSSDETFSVRDIWANVNVGDFTGAILRLSRLWQRPTSFSRLRPGRRLGT